MKLETKEYFKIQTPLFNRYDSSERLAKGYVAIAAFLERKGSNSSRFHWSLPTLGSRTFSSLRDFLAFGQDDSPAQWYDQHREEIEALRRQVLVFKAQDDVYFYTQAIIFALGSLLTIPQRIFSLCPSKALELFCYCMDFPEVLFGELEDVFRKNNQGYEEFSKYLPLPFCAWPSMRASENKQHHDRNSILLFDFMIDLSILILDSCRDQELTKNRTTQIRCYYKWLKKHNIYLPKELQEKIYRYL